MTMRLETISYKHHPIPDGDPVPPERSCGLCKKDMNADTDPHYGHEHVIDATTRIFHAFHMECLFSSFKMSPTCPTCTIQFEFTLNPVMIDNLISMHRRLTANRNNRKENQAYFRDIRQETLGHAYDQASVGAWRSVLDSTGDEGAAREALHAASEKRRREAEARAKLQEEQVLARLHQMNPQHPPRAQPPGLDPIPDLDPILEPDLILEDPDRENPSPLHRCIDAIFTCIDAIIGLASTLLTAICRLFTEFLETLRL